ncbi:MAG TPA: alkene reductase [Xanthobacteraceae bacterium]|nr:alkene reductase [Xanthobacteraceae bacterium]
MTQNDQAIDVFSSFELGPLHLPNRLVMAPMTRNRAGPGDVPGQISATYYVQRASAGLIVTEGTQVSAQGQGYARTPGIYSDAQVAGWKTITDAVHSAGGRIFLQLWHVGRISHPSVQPGGGIPVAPSALKPGGQVMTAQGMQDFVTPRALTTAEVAGVVEEFRRGAANAKRAGFDGVELHGANGYLIDQFLRDKANQRTDRYGGGALNRARFLIEVTEAIVGEWGGERVGVRLAPTNPFNDITDSNPAATFTVAVNELSRFGLGYLHIVEPLPTDPIAAGEKPDIEFFRRIWRGALMGNKGYDLARANAALHAGTVDLVSFAALFLANPDLPERFRRGAALNAPDRPTFYAGGEKGYIDYPAIGG